MPSFRYESLTATGETRGGVLAAADRADAIRIITGRGETATNLVEDRAAGRSEGAAAGRALATSIGSSSWTRPAAPAWLRRRGRTRPGMRRADMAALIRELATAIEAGLPLMNALRTVRRQAHGKAQPAILDHLIGRVEAGDLLHVAARDYGLPFDDMMVGMLGAADASGQMSEVLHQLADLLERSVELRREVLGATIYPMILAALIAISATIMVTILVPRLIEPLARDIELPWPTAVVLSTAEFISSYWIHCVVGIAAIWIAWRAWSTVPANRLTIDRLKLRVPVLGRLLRDVAVARFTRTLGTLTTAGLPILESLRITERTLGNTAMMQAISQVQDQVTSGKSLADPLERSGLFPPLLVQVVNLGERSGRLEGMLLHAASAFDRQVNASIKVFTRALPPVLIMVMAALGGFVLAAILLLLLQTQSMFG
jgi:type II secretory pathway component PulF